MNKPLSRYNIWLLSSIGREEITIPESLIKKLEPFGPRFVKVRKPVPGDEKSGKGPFEPEWQEHPYNADDPELLSWLKEGGNYGVMAGYGIIFADLDQPDQALEKRIKTFTIKSGRISGEGRHLYLRSDMTENALIYDRPWDSAGAIQIGNLQAVNKIVVGPNSRHNSGGTYLILKDIPIQWISRNELQEILGNRIKWTGDIKKEIDNDAKGDQLSQLVKISTLMNLRDSGFRVSGNERQGPCPFHDSTTGRNFSVNVVKNTWYCFRHNSGGGWQMFIAVKEGILKCEEVHPGALRDERYREVLEIAKKKYKIQIPLPNEEISPDVERFFEGKPKRLNPALVGAEMLKESHFFTKSTRGDIYRYNPANGIYEPEAEDFINTEVSKKLGKHYTANRRREVEAFIRSRTIKKLGETDKYLHAVMNGVLDIGTGELKEFNSDYYIFNALPVKYDPKAKCEKLLKFLGEVVPPEKDRVVLQEMAGYCLIKDTRFQKALLVVGMKQNGKGTFLNVISRLLGEDNVSNVELQKLNDNMRFITSQLLDRLANICADLPNKNLEETGTFKRIVSGDAIAAERKFGQPFEFRPYAKLLFSSNSLPDLPKDVEAFLVRWLLVEFPNSFLPGDPRRDENLIDKLTTPEELSGILNWAIQGAQSLLKNRGFSSSESLEELEDRWTIMSDSVKVFSERCTQDAPNESETNEKVLEAYLKFCDKRRVQPLSKQQFMKAFGEERTSQKTRVDNMYVRVWKNLRLKSEEERLDV
jgi:P4 family phage/plasmid primase-like protien